MIESVSRIIFLLAQTQDERSMTILGFTFLGAFLFYLILDSTIKNWHTPKNKKFRYFMIFLLLVCVFVVFAMFIWNK